MKPLAGGLVGVFFLTLGLALAEEPVIHSVEPAFGFTDEATEIRIEGEGFEAPIRSSLVHRSGPVLLAKDKSVDEVTDLALVGNLAYVCSRSELVVFDLSNPREPRRIHTVEMPDWAEHIEVEQGLAVVLGRDPKAFYRPWLAVLDLPSASPPVLVGFLELPGHAADLAFDGQFAYVAAGSGGLHVVDIREPESPRLVGTTVGLDSAYRVAVSNDVAAVADGSNKVAVVDVSTPESPSVLNIVETDSGIADVAMQEGLIVATGKERIGPWFGAGSLVLIDLRVPETPAIVGSALMPGTGREVILAGGLAYTFVWATSDYFDTLHVFDIRDAADPALVGSVDGLIGNQLAVGDGVACVTDLGRLQVLDVRNPLWDGVLGAWDKVGGLPDAALRGTIAYVIRNPPESGLSILDVTHPEFPREIGRIDDGFGFGRIAVSRGYAYVIPGLSVVDVREPSTAHVVSSLRLPGPAKALAADDEYLYVGGSAGFPSTGWLQIYSLTDPDSPTLVSQIETANGLRSIAINGDHVFLALYNWPDVSEVEVFNVSDPSAPRPLGSIETPGRVQGVVVSESRAYVAETIRPVSGVRRGALHVFEIPEGDIPPDLDPVGSIQLESLPWSLDVSGSLVYMGTVEDGVQVVDASDPTSPLLVGHLDVAGNPLTVSVEDGLVIAVGVSGDFGLQYGLFWALRPVISPKLEDVELLSGSAIAARIPAGSAPGPYAPGVASGDGAWSELVGSFRLCERVPIEATLSPSSLPSPPSISLGPTSWSITLPADSPALSSASSRDVVLALPTLTTRLDVEFVVAEYSLADVIELHLAPRLDSGLVRLIGRDEDALRAIWANALDEKGLTLPRITDELYGDFELTLNLGAPVADPIRDSTDPFVSVSPLVYRYRLADGALASAAAWGLDVDHVFRAKATYDWTCEVEDIVSFRATRRALCEEWVAENPGYVVDCEGL